MDRSIKTYQDKLKLIFITLTSTGTPAVSGIDANQVSSVVDNGAGDITIILKRPAHTDQDLMLVGQACESSTDPLLVTVESKDFDRINVNLWGITAGAYAKADGVVNLCIAVKDNKFNR